MANNRTYVRDFHGCIIGTIETGINGKKIARSFYGRYVGDYDPKTDTTRDFYGRIFGKGDQLSTLIYMEDEKDRARNKSRRQKR